jgi:hypothetical protein
MAQTDSDLTRHIAAAQRAVTRDCGGMGDCEWMHALRYTLVYEALSY